MRPGGVPGSRDLGAAAEAKDAGPDQTVDDTDEGWGEPRQDASREAWIRAQRPPHWD